MAVVTLIDVRGWQPAGIEVAFRGLGVARDRLLNSDTDLQQARPPADWLGAAAEGATREHERLAERMRRSVAGTTALRPVLSEAVDTITALRRDLERADGLAAVRGYTITPDGGIDTSTAPPLADEVQAHRRQLELTDLAQLLREVLRRADEVDVAMASALEQIAADRVDDGSGTDLAGAAGHVLGVRPPTAPPAGTAPADVAAWWNSLSGAQQEQLLLSKPAAIGNLDGVPPGIRDQANRALLDDEAARIDAEHAAIRARLDAVIAEERPGFDLVPNEGGRADMERRLAELDDQRAALAAVRQAIAGPDRQLLVLDLNGHHEPRAAVAVGDIATADHVAVFTPGLYSTVSGSLSDYTNDVAGVQTQAEYLLDTHQRGGETVAAVAWLGYDAPQSDTYLSPDGTVLATFAAQAGGTELARFLDGAAAVRPGDDPHLTALGHSYGSTTTGYALQETTVVDDAVLFGSPGSSTDDITDLNVAPGHVGVIEARGDVVADLGSFGTDPNHLPGAVQLSAEDATTPDNTKLRESTDHSAYLGSGTTSQYNIAATVAGLPELRITADDNSGFGDSLRGGLEVVARSN